MRTRKSNKRHLWCIAAMMLSAATLTSCLEDGSESIVLEEGKAKHGIPSDSQADPNPEITETTANVPNINYTVEYEDGDAILHIDMTGVQDPMTYDWLKLYGTGSSSQNVWVEVDGNPKGIYVYNNSDDDEDKVFMTDVVFLVDNSGSMREEADVIARDIISWANALSASNLDVRFGCVGYEGDITGALDITEVDELSEYLERYVGTLRTVGFYGSNASSLQSSSSSYYAYHGEQECGVVALRFADEQFSFRSGANRVYVNFTDEPNQPNGKSSWSVSYVESQDKWSTDKGTIHTVYSGSTSFSNSYLSDEWPWLLSEYTGGTVLYTTSEFSDVTLESLPVTGAMQNSYIIRFTDIDEYMDGKSHEVKITILSEDGNVKAEKIFYVVFGTL